MSDDIKAKIFNENHVATQLATLTTLLNYTGDLLDKVDDDAAKDPALVINGRSYVKTMLTSVVSIRESLNLSHVID